MEELGGGEGESVALVDLGDGIAVGAKLTDGVAVDAGGFADDHDFVAHFQRLVGLQLHFGNVDAAKIVADEAEIDLVLGGL